jgi:hypothetical protein
LEADVFSISAALESAYRSTTYVVRDPPRVLALRIGERCPAIERLLATRGVRSAAYMTGLEPHEPRRWQGAMPKRSAIARQLSRLRSPPRPACAGHPNTVAPCMLAPVLQ